MSRRIFAVAFLVFIFCSAVHAENAISFWGSSSSETNTIEVGKWVAFTFQTRTEFDTCDGWESFSNTFDLYSPDNAIWAAATQEHLFGSGYLFELARDWGRNNLGMNTYNWNGNDHDTLEVFGRDGIAPFGQIASFTGYLHITIDSFSSSDVGKTFCIDSCTTIQRKKTWIYGAYKSDRCYSPDFGGGPHAYAYTPGQGYCFTLVPPQTWAPTIITCPSIPIQLYFDSTQHFTVEATKGHCDSMFWSIGAVNPTPSGSLSINQNGEVTFTPNEQDRFNLYNVEVIASDCSGMADTCVVYFEVLPATPYSIKIETVHNSLFGVNQSVDVTLTGGSQPLGGFDLVIAIDSAMQFVDVTPGNPFFGDSSCAWEYFTYRYQPSGGSCNGGTCDFARIRVTGIAETNNGAVHPSCFLPDTLPATLFTLNLIPGFQDPCHSQCEFYPIRFIWLNCGDNTIANPAGDTLYISRQVFDYATGNSNIADSTGTYPTWRGAQLCDNPNPNKPDPVRFIDFNHGGIDMVCADSIDARGDINLNEISYEPGDAELFVKYFMEGVSAFVINTQGQIAASNVNGDTIPLSVADLVYLINGIIKDSVPCPIPSPPPITTDYHICNDTVSVSEAVGAAFFVAKGHVMPTLLSTNMEMAYSFDGVNTRILVYPDPYAETLQSFSGYIIADIGTLVSAEFGSPEGGLVNAQLDILDCGKPAPDTTSLTVRIEKTKGTYQGQDEWVDVILDKGTQELGGFDFLIAYDNRALRVDAVMPNRELFYDSTGCGWEYFTYRYSEFGDCGSACATGKIRVLGIAHDNAGIGYPRCFIPPTLPFVLFSFNFLVTDDRTYECAFLPIRFVWFDCGDNLFANVPGDTVFMSRMVQDTLGGNNIANTSDTYPTFAGAQQCADLQRSGWIRNVDFISGGIQTQCYNTIDARGDINLNEISNEVEDFTLFSTYFLYGIGVFNVNVHGQTAATDVNADGKELTLADLVYLGKVVVGDGHPFPKTSPPEMDASYTIANGKISIDSTVAAAVIVVAGNVTPSLLAPNMDMQYAFDGTNTHILVYTDISDRMTIETFTGSFLSVTGEIVSIEFATPDGGVVNASRAGGSLQSFILGQNYPNPFNATTRISFSLPQAGMYTLSIYNITGQTVFEYHTMGTTGINAVDWTAEKQASGVYFYKLTYSNVSETKKMIFLK